MTNKVSADDKSGVVIVDKLPVGKEKWSRLAKRFSKKSSKYIPANCLGRPPLKNPIYMGSFHTDKVSADDKSGV